MASPIIFSHKLAIYPAIAEEMGILTPDSLTWQHQGVKKQLNLSDVIGTAFFEQENYPFPCLLLYAYPKVKVGLTVKKYKRVFKQYCFTCADVFGRSQWQRAINNTLVSKPIDAVVKPRRLQIIINPVSGKQQASQIFEKVRPLFDCSNLEYSVIKTHSASETKDFVYNLNLSELDGLVIVGGDGTIS